MGNTIIDLFIYFCHGKANTAFVIWIENQGDKRVKMIFRESLDRKNIELMYALRFTEKGKKINRKYIPFWTCEKDDGKKSIFVIS